MDSCIFCKIIRNESPSTKEHEDDLALVIRNIRPLAKVHLLVIPKKHLASLNDAQETDRDLLGHLLLVGQRVAAKLGFASTGYKVVINCGEHGGQVVDHLHVHVLGGEPLRGVL